MVITITKHPNKTFLNRHVEVKIIKIEISKESDILRELILRRDSNGNG